LDKAKWWTVPKITVEGKPTLFFSASAADKSWRLTEKVVAVVESCLQGRDDAYVFSSAKIPNVVGDLTEVDVAFSSVSDPTELFEFVQVRDRAGTQGRPWVEQVMGQMKALEIDAATVVSTEEFSPYAIRLAHSQDIALRLLHPETEENIRKWYKADSLGVEQPLVEMVECRVIAKIGDRFQQFKAGRKRSSNNNILVPTREPHTYRLVSLSRVFDVDVMLGQRHHDEFLAQVPRDGVFHKALVGIEYEKPRLFLRFRGGIFPITHIAFLVMANRQFVDMPITYRYKYLDAASNQRIAEAIVGEATIEHQRHYMCLVRYSCDGETWQLGGAFFR